MENEKRLIELGEALRMIKNSKDDCPETTIKGRAIWETAHNCALSCLTNCDTADAFEVVHGRWIKVFDDSAGWVDLCNKCKEFGDGTPYCPNCGAKMDG